MTIKCQFNLSRSAGVYYTGEQISGTVTLSTEKKTVEIENIRIIFLGITTINWKESIKILPQIEHNDCSSHSEPICMEESYKSSITHIENTQQLANELLLLPDNPHLASFEFQLPQSLPATCRLIHGLTNYILEINLERQGKHVKSFQHRIIIKKCIELNDMMPQTKESSSLMCLKLSRSIFVPGQSVGYELETKQLPEFHITRLCQSVNYKSEIPYQKTKNVITILSESREMFGQLHLPLRTAIMTIEDHNDSMQISYFIETFYIQSGQELSLQLPIFVGTIAPPINSISIQSAPETMPLCFVNLALSQNELFMPINQLLANSCSREFKIMELGKHCEESIKLLQKKKKSYLRLALRYFNKTLLQ